MTQAQGIVMVPEQVEVVDDRGTVAGWGVRSTVHGRLGTVIPPEGTGIDCWADLDDWVIWCDELMDTIREWATHTDPADGIRIELGADAAVTGVSNSRYPACR